jgi:hypothetical protein
MKQKFIEYIHYYFERLIEIYGFSIKNEQNDGQSYFIEYNSNTFIVKLEKYRMEFYVTLYKLSNPEKEINLFNFLIYVNQPVSDYPKAEYFRNEKDIEVCYRKQLNYLTNLIYDNYDKINDFFSSSNYESKFADLEKFIIQKYPELFGKNKKSD